MEKVIKIVIKEVVESDSMRRTKVSLIVALALTLSLILVPMPFVIASSADWPMFRHDLYHTGHSTSYGPTTNDILWRYPTGGGVSSSPAVVGGMVYVGSGDGNVYCLNANSGVEVWSYTTGGAVFSSPAVVGGMVYVGSYDYNVYCLDANTGEEMWRYTAGDEVYSSPAVVGGMVYVGSKDNNTYCLDANTGVEVWRFPTGGEVYSSPAVVGGMVYVGSYDNNVYCLDANSGVEVWRFPTGGRVLSSPAVAEGRIYISSGDDNVYCLDADTGVEVWSYTTGGEVASSPAVLGGVVYVGSIDDNVYCLDANSGVEVWRFPTGGDVYSSPSVAGGVVYVGSLDGNVYCLDANTGVEVWSYTTGDKVFSSPAVAGGRVYIGSNDRMVYAFSTDWPMFRHDPNHTGYSTSYGPTTNETLWSYSPGGTVQSSPAVAGGRVYVGSCDNNVYCLDANTGEEVWRFPTGGWVLSSPAVAGGRVYIGSIDDNVYCLDANSGVEVWSYTTGGDVASSPAVAGGMVYIGSNDCNFYCLDANTGEEVWIYTSEWGFSDPAVAGGRVYIGSYDYNVYCLDANSGVEVWSYTTGGIVYSSPAVAGGMVYIGSYDYNVYCLDANTGVEVWRFPTGGEVYSSPAVAGGMVYIGSHDKNFYCLDANTGVEVWSYPTGRYVQSSPAVAGGMVYVGSRDGNVYSLDATTGEERWRYKGIDVRSSPAVAEGRLYVGFGYSVYAFGVGTVEDTTPPTVSVSIDPSDPDTTQTVSFTVTANDDAGGSSIDVFGLWVDGIPVETWTTAGTYSYTGGPYTQGTHPYHVEAIDNAGNTARDPATGDYTFTAGAGAYVFSAQLTEVEAPSEIGTGETFTVTITVDYDFSEPTEISPGIYDPAADEWIAEEYDTLEGRGTKTYSFELTAPEEETTWALEASVWYHLEGEWTHNEEEYSDAFEVEITGAYVFSAKLVEVEAPSTVQAGEDVTIELTVSYDFSEPTEVSPGIYDPATDELIAEEYDTLEGKGTKAYSFDLTAPSEEKTWELEASVYYKVDEEWLHDETGWGEAFEVEVEGKDGGGCLIATATYGSELAPEVQFLRGFRDNMALTTFAGSQFMRLFNAWYYSFSPAVASAIASSETLRTAMRAALSPLIGILRLSTSAFSLLSPNAEVGVIASGLVASSLIGVVYFMPWVLLLSFLKKFKPSPKTVRLTGLVWAGTVSAIALAEASASSPLMVASTGAFVIATICLTTLATVRAIMGHRV